MALGMFMAILDIQVVATSLPNIQQALGIAPELMSWIQTAYLIAEIIAIPLTGWITFGGFSEEVPAMAQAQLFGLFAMPQPPFTGEWAKELHELGSNAAMILIGLHVLAALKHQFIDKDGIFGRMLPW